MKVGDMVKLLESFGSRVGILISHGDFSVGWWKILIEDGIVDWPESQLEVINESR